MQPASEGHDVTSEFFGMKQRVDQIGGKPDRDEQSDECFSHDGLLQPVAEAHIERGEEKHAHAEGEKDEIGHFVYSRGWREDRD